MLVSLALSVGGCRGHLSQEQRDPSLVYPDEHANEDWSRHAEQRKARGEAATSPRTAEKPKQEAIAAHGLTWAELRWCLADVACRYVIERMDRQEESAARVSEQVQAEQRAELRTALQRMGQAIANPNGPTTTCTSMGSDGLVHTTCRESGR